MESFPVKGIMVFHPEKNPTMYTWSNPTINRCCWQTSCDSTCFGLAWKILVEDVLQHFVINRHYRITYQEHVVAAKLEKLLQRLECILDWQFFWPQFRTNGDPRWLLESQGWQQNDPISYQWWWFLKQRANVTSWYRQRDNMMIWHIWR